MNSNRYIIFFIISFCWSCYGAGSLGGWDTIVFRTSQKQLDSAIVTLYTQNPQYKIPNKWQYDIGLWKSDGYGILKANFFYFASKPEEMYYVTYIGAGTGGDPKLTRIAIRAIGYGNDQWKIRKDFDENENLRINKRFNDEIISKLEKYTKTKSYSEE